MAHAEPPRRGRDYPLSGVGPDRRAAREPRRRPGWRGRRTGRAGRPSFQLIQRRMGLASKPAVRARMSTTPVDYMAFDLLHLDGRCVRDLPYPERRGLLDGLVVGGLRWPAPALD